MTSRTGRRLLLVAAAIVINCAFPATAAAHAELVRAIPADGSTVSEPVTVISGRYSEGLTSASSLKVVDASGATVATGGVDPHDDRRMVARPEVALSNGAYTVQSTAGSADGHIERVEWTFTVEIAATPPPTPVPTPTATSAPPTTSPPPTATPSPAPSANPTPSPDPGTPTPSAGDVLPPIIAALAIVLVGAGFLLRRGGRSGRAG